MISQSVSQIARESFLQAQEDAEVLRSVVMPLEEEINTLKSKLKAAEMQLGISEGSMVSRVGGLLGQGKGVTFSASCGCGWKSINISL